MPQWTNIHDLPLPIVQAWTKDDYHTLANSLRQTLNGPMISVSALISPPQIRMLYARHSNKLTLDVSKRTAISAGHSLDSHMEQEGPWGTLQRWSHCRFVKGWMHPDDQIGPVYIAFEPDDVYLRKPEDGGSGYRLLDYKFTKVLAVRDGVKPERRMQLRLYRFFLATPNTYLCRFDPNVDTYHIYDFRPLDITRTTLVEVLKDWSPWMADQDAAYPQCDVHCTDIVDDPDDDLIDWINERISLHWKASKLPDEQLPECSDDERWARPDSYAVVYKDSRRAAKGATGFLTKEAAEECLRKIQKKTPMEVEFRPGISLRCERYCDVKAVCHQYGRMKSNGQ